MKKILVVDDSLAIRTAIRRLLEPMGFTVDEAENGEVALHYCEEWGGADAILLDIDMPVMDGLTFLRTLRGNTHLAQPPVVMCTTHSSLEKIATAVELGADEYIMKPFSAEIVAGKLATVGVGLA
ncbi:response regulator [Longimicrobium sp.]|uniref:response regulator n=1 Tax=Longimicrobium sp. TaxID=2029185 RepID=UPI002E2FFA03|nr:response regulator [Longimicrobium sp.]HEX6042517.1 response regulator [Longimicrobium sp.]